MLKQRYMTIGKFQRYLSEFIERCAPAIECWPSAVWRIATPIGAGAIHPISFPPTLSMVQRMLRQILLSALGWELPLDAFHTNSSFGPFEAKKVRG
jgi:hypothetical protein